MDQRRNSGTARLARGALAENGANALGARLLARFARVGYAASDVPVLQPAEPFLELSGEDIRRRLFVTSDDEGEELCLRPEFTIPAALAYLKSGVVGRRADLAFLGPVFRQRPVRMPNSGSSAPNPSGAVIAKPPMLISSRRCMAR